MAHKVVAMEAKLLAVLSAGLTGINVSEVCRQLQISRQTFYKYRQRFAEEGPAGLAVRSRRPHHSPGAISDELAAEIVRLRKALPVDNGAQAIAYHLRRGGWATPATSTIHRVLVGGGFVTPQPRKRPKSATRRFVWPRPNDAWQIDATRWLLADGAEAWIMDVLDDHSRLLVAARVCGGPTAAGAWDALCCGATDWGLPAHVMSDNGICFTGRFLAGKGAGGEAAFERNLRTLGVRHILSSPGHPQTCGKLERSHQTTKRWLATLEPAATPEELQAQLDAWREHYNTRRPHRGIGGATPMEAWTATERAGPAQPIDAIPESSLHTVSDTGNVGYKAQFTINVGRPHAGRKVLVIASGDDLTVFSDNTVIRRLTLDRTRRYQPSGNPHGRPRPRTIGPCS